MLYASTLNANRIYFGGYFIRNHPIVMRTMTFAVNFWSQVNVHFSTSNGSDFSFVGEVSKFDILRSPA